MTNEKRNLRIPKRRLARDSERVVQVWHRHEGKDPSLDARGAAVEPLARRYVEADRHHAALAQRAANKRRERDAAAAELRHGVLTWLPSLRGDLVGFDTTGLGDAEVAEDGVSSSRVMRGRVAILVLDGAELPYAAELESTLVAKEERVEAATRDADAASVAAEDARNERHAVAVELDKELVHFRATLRRVVGSTHSDYRRLRVRVHREELELEAELDLDAEDEATEGQAEEADPNAS